VELQAAVKITGLLVPEGKLHTLTNLSLFMRTVIPRAVSLSPSIHYDSRRISKMIYCARCGSRYPANAKIWKCSCKGELEYQAEEKDSILPSESLALPVHSIWRYREALPPLEDKDIVSLGEGLTPIISARCHGFPVWFKLDFLCPTGSYKDRGSSVMISCLKQMGITSVVEDSSGNAGASVAAYAGRAGMECTIFVPSGTSPAKLTQIRAYGARIKAISGTRQDVAEACQRAIEEDCNRQAFYASHNWNPFFLEGMKTLAYEIFEQCEMGKLMPDWVIVPAGYGSVALGAYGGFVNLMSWGRLSKLPRLIVVQAENCAPVYQAYVRGEMEVSPIRGTKTVAEGIACSNPIRGAQILSAARDSGGFVMAVSEEEINSAAMELAKDGIFVEPTSAVVAAALGRLISGGVIGKNDVALGILTGIGLKAGYYYDTII
jgi:threonine synthase